MCMGRTHVLMTGALATACANPLSEAFLGRSMTAPEIIAFGAVSAGYGLLPDFDHPQATLARVLGPITRSIASVIATVSGGHRKGTHTVWFAALMVLGFGWLFSQWEPAAAITIFIGLFLVAMILRLGPKPRSGRAELTYMALAGVGTAAIIFALPDPWWLPWAVGFGVIGHIVGDILTVEGVPIFYPILPRLYVRVPILGRTDSPMERGLAMLLGPAWIVAAWVAFNGSLGWTFPAISFPWSA